MSQGLITAKENQSVNPKDKNTLVFDSRNKTWTFYLKGGLPYEGVIPLPDVGVGTASPGVLTPATSVEIVHGLGYSPIFKVWLRREETTPKELIEFPTHRALSVSVDEQKLYVVIFTNTFPATDLSLLYLIGTMSLDDPADETLPANTDSFPVL